MISKCNRSINKPVAVPKDIITDDEWKNVNSLRKHRRKLFK